MNFHMPTNVMFGSGRAGTVESIVERELHCRKPFIITDKGIRASGILGKTVCTFDTTMVFDEVEPNPRASTVNRAAGIVREIQPDVIIAIGGGSVLDAGKAIALLAANPGEIQQYEGKEQYHNPPLPVVAVPTTCGTGSEVTWVAVITDETRRFKMSIKGRHMYPVVAVVDPDLLQSLPVRLIAATGLDALTHAIEAFTAKPATPITDLFAYRAIELIATALPKAASADHENAPAALSNLMLGSTMAGFAFGNSDVGAVHCLSESIGALFDVPHGIANALLLPHVMRFNAPICMDKYAQIAGCFGIFESNSEKAAHALINTLHSLIRELDIPSFHELGISGSEFDLIAEYSFQNNSNPSNPREATVADYHDMLQWAADEIRGERITLPCPP